jgi:uncharacterized protein with NRDE domain
MCLILLATQKHPDYKLILAANRDEYYDRASESARFWEGAPDVLAGRDLVGNGTWLGITKSGRIAAVTNYRDPANVKAKAPSRGKLAGDFLSNTVELEEYLKGIRAEKDRYNGFNLLLGNGEALYWYSNRTDQIVPLSQGVYGLSNHLLDTPWPKVERAKNLFRAILRPGVKLSPEALFELLHDPTKAPDDRLPRTGVPLEWERILSPIFIASPTYGTRASTIVLIDRENHVTFLEKTFNAGPEPISAVQFEFDLQN